MAFPKYPVVNGLKICSKCLKTKEVSEFHVVKDRRTKAGLTTRPAAQCKSCAHKQTFSSFRQSPNYFNTKYFHKIKTRYNLTPKQYYEMLEAQNGVCAICKELPAPVGQKKLPGFQVDHCHATGKVRGLLCTFCNSTLGYSKDNIDRLINCAIYLEKFHNT